MPRRGSRLEFTEPAAVVIKHTNPCGVATGMPAAEAYVRARDADPLSAFGGIVGLNRPIDVRRREGDHLDVHRSGDRAVGRRCGAGDAGDEAEHASRHRRLYARRSLSPGATRREIRGFLGGVLTQEPDRSTKRRDALAARRRSRGRDEAPADGG